MVYLESLRPRLWLLISELLVSLIESCSLYFESLILNILSFLLQLLYLISQEFISQICLHRLGMVKVPSIDGALAQIKVDFFTA